MLLAVTSIMTVVLVLQVGARIEELTYSYVPAYGDLARANIRSLERALHRSGGDVISSGRGKWC